MEKATTFIETAGKTIAAAWTLDRVIGGLVSFTGEIVNTAGAMVDMSQKTGLSLDTIQRMEFVAGQTGATLDDFSNAAFILGKTIAGGGSSVEQAVQRLGLSFTSLRAQSPDQQFVTIATALHTMANEQQRNAVAVDLFGKTAKPIMASIAEGYADIAKQARVSGDAQIHALDDAADAWDRFVKDRKRDATDLLGSFVLAGQGAGKVGILNVLDLLIKQGPLAVDTLAQVGAAAKQTGKDINLPAPPIDPIIAYRQHLDELCASMKALSPAQQALVREGKAVGDSTKDIADGLGLSERAVKAFIEAEQEAEAAHQRYKKVADDWIQIQDEMAKASRKMSDEMVADFQKAALDMANVIAGQQMKLRELAGDAQAANAALYGQGGGGMDSAIAANEQARADKLNALHLGTLNLNDPNSQALIEQTQRSINDSYDRMFNDIVTKADQFGDDVAGTIAASEPRLAAASGQAAGSIQNNFLQIFGNVESRAGQMVDSVTGAIRAMQMDDAYREAGFFVDSTGPASILQRRAARGYTAAALPHMATGGVVTSPTVAMIGEKGPEAIIPLDRAGGSIGGHTFNLTLNVMGGKPAADELMAYLRARGVHL